MTRATIIGLGLLLGALGAGALSPAFAADPARCLSPAERRIAIADKRAVPLGRALRAARARANGDILRARLCDGQPGLVYQLTVLGRDGKVTHATVDAATGQLLGASR
jgi:uncharacterized membrane protein YkoI